jgi:hypothetical protein
LRNLENLPDDVSIFLVTALIKDSDSVTLPCRRIKIPGHEINHELNAVTVVQAKWLDLMSQIYDDVEASGQYFYVVTDILVASNNLHSQSKLSYIDKEIEPICVKTGDILCFSLDDNKLTCTYDLRAMLNLFSYEMLCLAYDFDLSESA